MAEATRSNLEIIGRDEINDIEAIVRAVAPEGVEHAVESGGLTSFTWDYEIARPALHRLYEKAKTSQWNASTDVDWSIDVDQEEIASGMSALNPETMFFKEKARNDRAFPLYGWGDDEFIRLGVEQQAYTLSQFMHGEQGALICTAKIVEQVPWIDAKYYASTQVIDEARHVEVFARYLNDKLDGEYPVNPHLLDLLDDIIRGDLWDMTYLGMQVMVEGLALAAFGLMHQITTEPLLKKILRYVMSDEARHVAFGVLSLQDVYAEMSQGELRERQEFAFEAGLRMRDRLMPVAVWERMGVDPFDLYSWLGENTDQTMIQGILFSKIVPNVKKLGLLDAGDGWLRRKYEEMGVIEFENLMDTGEEYEALDEVAFDRASA